MLQNLLTNEEIHRLTNLKNKWTPDKIYKESFEQYAPNNVVLSRWMYQRWRYERKLLNEGR